MTVFICIPTKGFSICLLKKDFDAIIACIGFDREFPEIIDLDISRLEDLKVSIKKQLHFGKDGSYFCGFWIGPTGLIREIGLDAKKNCKGYF